MTDREFFIETIKDELPRFERVLNAVPADKIDWRAHPKNKSAWDLIKDTFGGESLTFEVFLKTGSLDWALLQPPAYKAVNNVWDAMKQGLEAAEQIAKTMNEDDWESKAVMKMGEKVVWESTRGRMAWSLLFDLIHHRGQLSTYLRPMGGKVPSIYGPSGDDQGD